MIDQRDIIYFVVTDRFCKGDAPVHSSGDADLATDNPQGFHGGDFQGLIDKIPYLKELGITALWITPVYVNIADFFSSAGYHGYWAMDFERVDHHLYSPKDGRSIGSRLYLKDLVDIFHQNSIKIILDMVVNHTGYHTPDYIRYSHKKFNHSHFNTGQGDVEGSLSGLPDLDHDQAYVADYFVQNILDWIEDTGIDGIRMDTVKHVEDRFWYLFKSQIKTRHPHVTLIGEVLNWHPSYIARYQQQHDFDTLFDFPLCGTLKGTLIWDQPMTNLARPRLSAHETKGRLDEDKVYTNANRLVTLLDNHDLDRRITTEVFDRVGEWDRDLALRILKLCISFQFTTRGIPQIFYGTEIGLRGKKDPDNRRDMPWHLFGSNHVPKSEHPFEQSLYTHLQNAIRIRKENPAICYGYLFTLYVDASLYVYMREFRGNVVLVAINNARSALSQSVPVQIRENSNIPPRIVELISAKGILKSQIAEIADLTPLNGDVGVHLPAKTAGIWTI